MSFDRQLPILELQYVDSSGSKGTVTMRCKPSSTYADIAASADALAAIIAPITSATLTRVRIIYKSVATPRAAATTESPIKRSGAFFLQNNTGEHLTSFYVPSIIDDILVVDGSGAGVLIDIALPSVLALTDAVLALPATDPFGVVMSELMAAYRQSR